MAFFSNGYGNAENYASFKLFDFSPAQTKTIKNENQIFLKGGAKPNVLPKYVKLFDGASG